MNWVRRIMLWVGILLIVAIAAAYMLPRNVRVERSATIGAPQATLFTLLNSFKQFNKWSPWFELDPAAKYTHEGPGAGVGAKLSWVGNPRTLGSGSQTITASEPYEKIAADVDFGQGGGPAKQVYTLAAEETGTKLTWSMDVDLGMNPIARYFGLGFEGTIGKDFDKGLVLLKALAEGLPKADFAGLQIEAVLVERGACGVRGHVEPEKRRSPDGRDCEGLRRAGRVHGHPQGEAGGRADHHRHRLQRHGLFLRRGDSRRQRPR